MALGIIVLLIGIPFGLLMLFKPREVWRATEGWKFRNPDANEPSREAYLLSGVGVIAGTLLIAVLAFTKPDDAPSTRATTAPATDAIVVQLHAAAAHGVHAAASDGARVAGHDRLPHRSGARRHSGCDGVLLGAGGRVEGAGRRPTAAGAVRARAEGDGRGHRSRRRRRRPGLVTHHGVERHDERRLPGAGRRRIPSDALTWSGRSRRRRSCSPASRKPTPRCPDWPRHRGRSPTPRPGPRRPPTACSRTAAARSWPRCTARCPPARSRGRCRSSCSRRTAHRDRTRTC